MDEREATAAHYKDSSKLAVRGGFHARYSHHSWFDWVDQRLGLASDARVLDVGCGPGWFWNACTHLPDGMQLTLLDASAHMVAQAAGRLTHLNIADAVVADAISLPFPDQSFDVVTAMHMLYHLPKPELVLQEMRRVLVPGGRCLVTTNNPRNLPQIATLSHTAFGSAIDDTVQGRFGTPVALELMSRQFVNIEQKTYEDVYQVDDVAPVIEMLMTMPPGDKADVDGRARLEQAVTDLMQAHGGIIRMPNVQDLISGVRAE
jgi:ubiquinone/menaquinone biosynthesis C-methylase UbiE